MTTDLLSIDDMNTQTQSEYANSSANSDKIDTSSYYNIISDNYQYYVKPYSGYIDFFVPAAALVYYACKAVDPKWFIGYQTAAFAASYASDTLHAYGYISAEFNDILKNLAGTAIFNNSATSFPAKWGVSSFADKAFIAPPLMFNIMLESKLFHQMHSEDPLDFKPTKLDAINIASSFSIAFGLKWMVNPIIKNMPAYAKYPLAFMAGGAQYVINKLLNNFLSYFVGDSKFGYSEVELSKHISKLISKLESAEYNMSFDENATQETKDKSIAAIQKAIFAVKEYVKDNAVLIESKLADKDKNLHLSNIVQIVDETLQTSLAENEGNLTVYPQMRATLSGFTSNAIEYANWGSDEFKSFFHADNLVKFFLGGVNNLLYTATTSNGTNEFFGLNKFGFDVKEPNIYPTYSALPQSFMIETLEQTLRSYTPNLMEDVSIALVTPILSIGNYFSSSNDIGTINTIALNTTVASDDVVIDAATLATAPTTQEPMQDAPALVENTMLIATSADAENVTEIVVPAVTAVDDVDSSELIQPVNVDSLAIASGIAA